MTSLSAVHSKLLRLAWLIAARNVEIKLDRLARTLKAGFDPNQPRVSAGSPDGGQWTSGGGNAVSEDPTRLAQGDRLEGYPVDLREEDAQGGHTIRKHVGKSPLYLSAQVRQEAARIIARGDYFSGLAVGSFSSLLSATRLVNSTLSRNQALVDRVARGSEPFDVVRARFDAATGYEAYLDRFNAEPFMRNTYWVSIFIIHDPRRESGFRVHSAYPSN